jgi:glycine cleavage system transcriptional repressor
LADRSLDLAAVRSHAEETADGEPIQNVFLAINVPEKVDIEQLEQNIIELAEELNLSCNIERMQGIDSNQKESE